MTMRRRLFRSVLVWALGVTAVLVSSVASAQALRPRTDIAQNDEGHMVWIAGDAQRGREVYGQCRSCHAIGPRAEHRTGPHFVDLIGRVAGSSEGYPYSLVLVKLGLDELRWTSLALEHFLWNPDGVISDGPMLHAGISDPQMRADLIAFLKDPDSVR